MKKWSCFFIALFTLAACGKESFENPKLADHQAILDAHTAFYEDVVVNLIDGIHQHPELPVEKMLANEPEALMADLVARGILDRSTVEEAGQKLYVALEKAGYFNDERLRGDVDKLLVENTRVQGKKHGIAAHTQTASEIAIRVKTSPENALEAMGTPCYDEWENDMIAATAAFGACMLASTPTLALAAGCAVGYGVAVMAIDHAFEQCLRNR